MFGSGKDVVGLDWRHAWGNLNWRRPQVAQILIEGSSSR
jgi:hypothetical protein